MKKMSAATRLGLAVAIFLAAGLAWGAEGKPDFSGEWKMNGEKSYYGVLSAPISRTDRIEHKEPKLKITRRETHQRGESTAQAAVELNCVLDGSECSVKITGPPLRLKTKVKWEKDTLVFDSAGTFGEREVTIHEEWSLAADGKSITIRRALTGQQGTAHQTIVLEKQ